MVSIYTGDNQEWLSQQIGDLLQSVAHEATGKSHPEVLDETVQRVVETLWSKMESMAYAIEYLSRGREDLEVFPEHLKTSGDAMSHWWATANAVEKFGRPNLCVGADIARRIAAEVLPHVRDLLTEE